MTFLVVLSQAAAKILDAADEKEEDAKEAYEKVFR